MKGNEMKIVTLEEESKSGSGSLEKNSIYLIVAQKCNTHLWVQDISSKEGSTGITNYGSIEI